MKKFYDLDLNEIEQLISDKDIALKNGDFLKLIQLKKNYPEVFDQKSLEDCYELRFILNYLSQTDHFKNLLREEEKKNFVIISDINLEQGQIDSILAEIKVIYYRDLNKITRPIVHECLGLIIKILSETAENCDIASAFPFLGIMIENILSNTQLPIRREKLLNDFLFLALQQNISFDDFLQTQQPNLSLPNLTVNDEFFSKLVKRVKCFIRKITASFDSRPGFNSDLHLFLFCELAKYLGLLASNIAKPDYESQEAAILRVLNTYSRTLLIQH